VMKPRKIIHLDLDAFFCAVEELHTPNLVGKAFAVGGRPESRGIVASCSYAARMDGVHSAMPTAQALRLCPGLILIPSRHGVYSHVSAQVMDTLNGLTPLVEQASIDEAFLDVSDLPEDGRHLAERLQTAIRQELHLPCSLGVATNKLVAKVATDVGKAARRGPTPPCAIVVVPAGQEAAFLAPLPVNALWGVGPKTADRMERLGIRTIGDLADFPETELVTLFGKNGYDLYRHARGLDDGPVTTSRITKSISQETTFEKDVRDASDLKNTLHELSAGVGQNLRQAKLAGSTVKLKLRWSDFTTITRQTTLDQPTDQDGILYAAIQALFDQAWERGRLVRLLGVGVSQLGPAYRQLSLWETPKEKEHNLLEAIDTLRERFGSDIIQRGRADPLKSRK
jgi:DNA polymerase IV